MEGPSLPYEVPGSGHQNEVGDESAVAGVPNAEAPQRGLLVDEMACRVAVYAMEEVPDEHQHQHAVAQGLDDLAGPANQDEAAYEVVHGPLDLSAAYAAGAATDPLEALNAEVRSNVHQNAAILVAVDTDCAVTVMGSDSDLVAPLG